MGAAIRHATARFNGVESRRRLLLILSDGRPEDYDDGGDRRYLHEDTRMAVKEAMAAGVHPFCITVDTMANQYLPQIFGRGHYLVLDHINSLPNKSANIMTPIPTHYLGRDAQTGSAPGWISTTSAFPTWLLN
jgi:nitric oxide reductase activation protein